EDSRGTRESLTELLERAPGLRCVGAHASGEQALQSIPTESPDVVLMDINLPGMSGIECVARLKERLPKLQVLMLTTYEESDLIFDSLRKGASGYLLKNMPPAELVQAVEQVHSGGAPMSMQIARKVVNHFQQIKQPSSEVEKTHQTGAGNPGVVGEAPRSVAHSGGGEIPGAVMESVIRNISNQCSVF